MKPTYLKVASIAIIFLLAGSGNAFAWGSRTHMKIVSDAFHIMPQAFRDFLGKVSNPEVKKRVLNDLMVGSVEPDRVLKDFQNHIFHIQAMSMGKGPFHVESLVNEVGEAIAKKSSKKEIIQKLGWIGHYAADLVQPLHTGSSLDETVEEKSYHSATEKDADRWVLTYGVNFDGCDSVKRISARMIYESLWANQYYDALEQAYTKGKRYEESREILANAYSRAVNDVVDMWYSAWVAGGGKVLPSDKKPRYFPAVKKFGFIE
ncbi:MAG: zinc dependent phospholipase C family protein [Candidatus Riflebacteria bacterium]|nr:zinc dependent phospholipase C family protein [Candidatus Riflebacteria bacterium]